MSEVVLPPPHNLDIPHTPVTRKHTHTALVDNTINSGQVGRGGPVQGGSVAAHEEHSARAYKLTLLYGRIRQAVQRATIWEIRGGAWNG